MDYQFISEKQSIKNNKQELGERKMRMYCFQCQETMQNIGCRFNKGACGKPAKTACLQDALVYALKGIAIASEGKYNRDNGLFIAKSLFATITNANWDDVKFVEFINEALQRRDALKSTCNCEEITWTGKTEEDNETVKEVGDIK